MYVNDNLTIRWTESPGNYFVSPAAVTWAAPVKVIRLTINGVEQ
jgi:hypothetical protein